jgi:cardiolipin synthase A/B
LKRRALGRALCEAKPALLLLAAAVALFAGCGTIPDVRALLHASVLYQDDADFVGARGPLIEEQGQRIIERLEERQQTPSDILQRHLAFEQALSDVPLVVGNKVTPLKNANETYRAMLAAIRNAHDSINIEMYIFSDGPIGKMFADALIERERHGVQVNLAYDSFGSFSTSASFFDRMQQNGIAVLQYRPLNPFEAKLHWTLGHRNHRKMIIVDGGIALPAGSTSPRSTPAGWAAGRHAFRWNIGAIPISSSRARSWRKCNDCSSVSGTASKVRLSASATTFQSWNGRETRSCG